MEQSQHISGISFEQLTQGIIEVSQATKARAAKAIDSIYTVRNWIVGAYIVEYEQNGSDRAIYGEMLLKRLSDRLKNSDFNLTLLKNSRSFYIDYPQIRTQIQKSPTLSDFSKKLLGSNPQEVSAQFDIIEFGKSPTLSDEFQTPADKLISRLSFSHIVELLTIDDPLVRYFYEFECIRGTWSVRELRRQIATNLHIRVGLSADKMKAMEEVNAKAEHQSTELILRDPHIFEFAGFKASEVVSEDQLEEALISHLQEFLLEMGKGFCFEARQKRIIIDGEYYFADLVLYNRILHASTIIELKNDEFRHEHIGQLNAYVRYYAENEMHPGDNPPIGILLCTKKGKKMVEYALGGMDQQLFVSTYKLQLPNPEVLQQFLRDQLKNQE